MSDGMDRVDPFDEFEFKPLTDGLGFHKKAEKIKKDVKASQIAFDATARTVPEPPPKGLSKAMETAPSAARRDSLPELSLDLGADSQTSGTKSASQSISDLIASLPPSLDFVDNKGAQQQSHGGSRSEPAGYVRPQIFQPLAPREEFKTSPRESLAPQISPQALKGQMAQSSGGPTIGSVLPAPGSRVGSSGNAAASASSGVAGSSAGSMPAAAPTSAYRDRLNESFAKAFPHVERAPLGMGQGAARPAVEGERLEPVIHNMPGAIVDGMVVLGISTIFLVCILAITHVNLMGLLGNAQTDGPTQVHLALLFMAVLQMYMLTARSFFGASLGEWAFDLQVGSLEEQKLAIYPLLVAWRTLLVTLTGFVVLPLISIFLKRDVTKSLTGLALLHHP